MRQMDARAQTQFHSARKRLIDISIRLIWIARLGGVGKT